ncbi:MAG: FtsX-like permease family protein [Anditalea sp.]
MKLLKDLKLSSSIAFTHMRAKLKQTVIGMVGVAFGITVFIFMVSFIKGTNTYVQDIIFEQSPHLRLYNEVQIAEKTLLDKIAPNSVNVVHHLKPKDILPNLKGGKQVVQELKQDSRVEAVSGVISTQVFYRLGSSSINGLVNGINFEDENALFNLGSKLVEGSFAELSTKSNSMVMGVGLAEKLNVKTGDKLHITTENGDSFLVTIIGLLKTGITDIDKQQSYANIKTVQRFLRVPSAYITNIKIKLQNREQAPELSGEFQRKYNYQGSDWKKDNAALLEGDVLRNMIVFGVAGTILLVAGFGIFNILTMMIYEKMKDIAILKAMGFSDTDVRWIFLTQALVIGLVGALLGLVFGLLTTALSGYIPSRKAANVDPISI